MEKEYFGYTHAELEVASWDLGLALPEVKAVAWHHQAKPETEPPPTVRGLVYQARCMERATVIEIVLKPAIKGIDVTSQHCWQGRQRDAGGLNDGLLLHNNSFPSGDGLENVFQYCVVYAENCFKLFGARSCRAGQRHQILDWRHRFSPAGIVCADGPLAFNPEYLRSRVRCRSNGWYGLGRLLLFE